MLYQNCGPLLEDENAGTQQSYLKALVADFSAYILCVRKKAENKLQVK
jgi:hypothetical protein